MSSSSSLLPLSFLWFLSPSFGWTEVLSSSEVTGEGGPPVFWALYTIDIGLVIFAAITLELFGDLVFYSHFWIRIGQSTVRFDR